MIGNFGHEVAGLNPSFRDEGIKRGDIWYRFIEITGKSKNNCNNVGASVC
jgi:hypothetical protein